jgi:hypothetical protein
MSCSHDASYGGACVVVGGNGARLCDAEGEGTGV